MLGHLKGCRLIALVGMSLTAAFSLIGVFANDPQVVTIWFALAFGSLGLCEPLFWTTAPMLERKGGLACSLVNTGGNGIGMLAPLLTPILAQAFGWSSAIVVACLVCGAGGLLWFGVRHNADSR